MPDGLTLWFVPLVCVILHTVLCDWQPDQAAVRTGLPLQRPNDRRQRCGGVRRDRGRERWGF